MDDRPDWFGPASDLLKERGFDEAAEWLDEYAAWKAKMGELFGCQLDPGRLNPSPLRIECPNEAWNYLPAPEPNETAPDPEIRGGYR